MAGDSRNPIILYDGVCGLCNRFVQFLLKHDPHGRFRFASLQSEFAAPLLRRHGASPEDLDTVYLVLDYAQPGEHLAARSDAALRVLQDLGGFWGAVARLLGLLPKWLCDWGYNQIARHRHRVFGKYDTCPLPKASDRHKFLDLE
jgi:predicted DCC family thiol-disulfide oxidoreductase YuxK